VPETAIPFIFTFVTTFDPEVVASPLNSAAVMAEELPRIKPVSVLPVPVPPFGTGKIPVTAVVSGNPVRLVATPEAGVPSAGAVNVGEVSVRPAILVVVDPEAIDVLPSVIGNPLAGVKHPVALPFASTPIAACVEVQVVGKAARAVAVPAFPVVL
jgi:hypothetical protein